MGVLVGIDVTPLAIGLLEVETVGSPEWRVSIVEVPRVAAFCFGDVVLVDARGASTATGTPRPFIRVVERGAFQRSLRVAHSLDEVAVDAWLDELESAGWATLAEEGVVWLAAPNGVDARAELAKNAWVGEVSEAQ